VTEQRDPARPKQAAPGIDDAQRRQVGCVQDVAQDHDVGAFAMTRDCLQIGLDDVKIAQPQLFDDRMQCCSVRWRLVDGDHAGRAVVEQPAQA
jgi:hypothetical protein